MSKSHSPRLFLHGSAPETRAVESPPTLVDVTAHILPSIQAEREYPAVSVVLAVTGPAFGLDDRTRGEALVSEAARRLAFELDPRAVEAMVDPLGRALANLVGARVEGGVALLRAIGELHAFRLTVTPSERVVIDPTFATRDLVRSVTGSEPYGIVVLAKDQARLLVVSANGARRVAEIDERTPQDHDVDRRGHLHQPERSGRDQRQFDAFLGRVSHQVNCEPALRSLDVVVVAPDPIATRFQRLHDAKEGAQIAGHVPGNRLSASPDSLADLTRTVMRSHRTARERVVLDELANAERAGRAERGIDATWSALQQSSSLHLIVEDGFAFAAYLATDGTHVIPAAVPETPSATDDLVDEMIELAMSKHGTVSFVEPGSLDGDGVAVIRNYRLHSAS
ncbi:MAG: hypothetical protein ABIP21_11110 [Acidimicrobiia bacterium]